MWGALLNPSPSNWQKRPPTSLEFVWMHFKVNIWLPTDCWTSFLAGHFCQFILLNFISRNFFHSIPSDSPSSIIHSFVHFFRFAANWFNIHANFLFADLYYNNFYAQLSYKLHLLLRNCNVPISCPCPSLPFSLHPPTSVPSALLALCIYANVKEKFSHFKFSDYIWAAAERLCLTLKSANINFSLAVERDAV